MTFAGVCHTDAYTLSGQDSEGAFPVVLGHEGAGIVESVGEGVTSVKPGDKVIPCYIPQCYDCEYCARKETNVCSKIRATQGKSSNMYYICHFEVTIRAGRAEGNYVLCTPWHVGI